jgi:nitrogen regulatory protein P-II 1
MKRVEAIINPFKLDEVRAALLEVGIEAIIVTEARGFGLQKAHTEFYRGAKYVIDFSPMARIEAVMQDALVVRAVDAMLQAAAGAGCVGDGVILITTVEEAIRIRARDKGTEAIRSVGSAESLASMAGNVQ